MFSNLIFSQGIFLCGSTGSLIISSFLLECLFYLAYEVKLYRHLALSSPSDDEGTNFYFASSSVSNKYETSIVYRP